MASSSEEMRLVELFEIQSQEGPCPDCFRTGQPTLNVDLATGEVPWALFGPVALKAGFRSVHALRRLVAPLGERTPGTAQRAEFEPCLNRPGSHPWGFRLAQRGYSRVDCGMCPRR